MHARIYFLLIIFAAAIAGFKDEKIKSLTIENKDLRQSLQAHEKLGGSKKEYVPSFSVHLTRDGLIAATPGATSFSDDAGQPEIGASVRKMAERIADISKQLKSSRNEALAYLTMIEALRSELNIKDAQVHRLHEDLGNYQLNIEGLIDSLTRTEVALEKAREIIGHRQNDSALEAEVRELTKNLRIAEADICYERARRDHLSANKIMFSPSRKKELLMEALEGYKKALFLGKKEASENISELQKSLYSAAGLGQVSIPPATKFMKPADGRMTSPIGAISH